MGAGRLGVGWGKGTVAKKTKMESRGVQRKGQWGETGDASEKGSAAVCN